MEPGVVPLCHLGEVKPIPTGEVKGPAGLYLHDPGPSQSAQQPLPSEELEEKRPWAVNVHCVQLEIL